LAVGGIPGILQDGFLENRSGQPLFSFIGRLTDQKGVDILIAALKKILPIAPNFQLLILGSGDSSYEEELVGLAGQESLAGRVCFLRGYDPHLANMVYAAGDFFLIPSHFEPCGLTDFMAQLFGNLPIVHRVGGLVKVRDGETGFAYEGHEPSELIHAMERAMLLFRDSPKKIIKMQQAAVRLINKRYTWEKVVGQYLDLYERAATTPVMARSTIVCES